MDNGYENSDTSIAEFLNEHSLHDEYVKKRLISLKKALEQKKQEPVTYEELLIFLKWAMDFDGMQLWLIEQQFAERELTEEEKLKKFFELKSAEKILSMYASYSNHGDENLKNIRLALRRYYN